MYITFIARLTICIRLGKPKLMRDPAAPAIRVFFPFLLPIVDILLLVVNILSRNMAAPNSYFVPGFGISRTVIQNEIRYHCGPDAIVRPYTFQVRLK